MTSVPKASVHHDGVSIRTATGDDVSRITRLINAAFVEEQFVFDGDRINAEQTRAFLESGKFLVAENSRGFSACVYAEVRENRGYLGLLAVDPALQGTGLGSKMVAAAEDYFRAAGCCAVDLRILSPRLPLPAFYRRLGYVEVATRPFAPSLETKVPGHYIIMSKSLL